MDQLATVPVLADYDRGFTRCAVHQQTQRSYALGEADEGNQALVLFDTHLQVIATVEATQHDLDRPIRDVAVHGDQVLVLTSDDHAKGSGLRLLDLDGRFLRTIAAGQFQNPQAVNPQAVAALHGRAFVIDDDEDDDDDEEEEPCKTLHVIDIQSGDILQSVPLDLEGYVSAILVDGDEIYISSFGADEVVVLQLAGSEA
eukprot:scaffold57411_cov65-Phaeocystis_antarctica.AAC.7